MGKVEPVWAIFLTLIDLNQILLCVRLFYLSLLLTSFTIARPIRQKGNVPGKKIRAALSNEFHDTSNANISSADYNTLKQCFRNTDI